MPVNIFFCYAREDEVLLNKLKIHLRSLQWEGLIEVWHDCNISPGTEWEQEISKHLNAAQIILLLVSPDFMNSDYCYSIEMKRAVERHERKEARVIPVILEHVSWQVNPLNKLQALPTDAKPVISASWHSINEALYNVTEGIRKVVEQLIVQDLSVLPIVAKEAQQQVIQAGSIPSITELVRDVSPFMTPPTVKIFEYQEDAYHYLIGMIQRYGAREAVLLQYSCHTGLPILRMLLRKGAKVTLFIQHEDTAAAIGSQLQADLIRDTTTRNLRSNLSDIPVGPDKLKVYKYRVPSSMSAIKIDNQILCMGWYTYEQKERLNDKTYPDDTVDVSGHDRAALVVYKETNEFQVLNKMFSILEKNYREHAELVTI